MYEQKLFFYYMLIFLFYVKGHCTKWFTNTAKYISSTYLHEQKFCRFVGGTHEWWKRKSTKHWSFWYFWMNKCLNIQCIQKHSCSSAYFLKNMTLKPLQCITQALINNMIDTVEKYLSYCSTKEMFVSKQKEGQGHIILLKTVILRNVLSPPDLSISCLLKFIGKTSKKSVTPVKPTS